MKTLADLVREKNGETFDEARAECKPLGVVASIAPFNFPSMVPPWTISNVLVLGHCRF